MDALWMSPEQRPEGWMARELVGRADKNKMRKHRKTWWKLLGWTPRKLVMVVASKTIV
jgi:hypothetical protein